MKNLLGLAIVAMALSSPGLASQGENNRLPEFMHVQGRGLASSWDGRLVFDVKYAGFNELEEKHKFSWLVRVFRPEKVGSSGDPLVDVQNVPDLFSDGEVFDWDEGSPNHPGSPSPSAADGRLHMAVYPDSQYPENPYRSDESGQADPSGSYETYQMRIIGKYEDVLSSNVPSEEKFWLLGRHGIQVVVSNPRTETAAIKRAEVLSQVRLLRAGTKILHGIEPTISMDGRLMIWHGHPSDDSLLRYLLYSYNPDPHAVDSSPASVDDTGWSPPQTVSAMYATHGPGAATETLLPDGTKFSDAYPIARRPLSVFALQGGVSQFSELDATIPLTGAYPWLSWDASELFFPYVADFKAHLRNGFSVIGARTNWRLEHVDGPINWTRGNVTDSVTNWVNEPEGEVLKAAYGALSEEVHAQSFELCGSQSPNQCLVGNVSMDHETLLVAPLGLGHSMWSVSPGDPGARVPYFGGRDTYAMITSHSGRYFEVPLFRGRDGRFIASFPFNEALRLDVEKTQQLVQTTYGSLLWELARDATTYQPTYTTDVSGNGSVGELTGGAAFPYEYNDAKAEWANNGTLKDYTEGLKGNSIYFPPGSFVKATLDGELIQSMGGRSGWAISFWLKALEDLTAESFPFLSLGSNLLYMGNWGSYIKFGVRKESSGELLTDINMVPAAGVLSTGAGWKNIAISYLQGELSMYLDGEFVGKESLSEEAARYLESALSDGNSRNLRIGPRNLAGSSGSAVMMMDEIDLLNSPLDAQTLSRLSFSGPAVSPAPSQAVRDLGRQLFFDTRLSANQTFSCGTCHQPSASYGDDSATSPGIYGRAGSRNTPALLGVPAGHSKMLTATVPNAEAQWQLPLGSEAEMGVSLDVVLDRLALDTDLVAEMVTLFGAGPSEESVGQALAAYVDSLSVQADLDHASIVGHPGRELFLGKARCSNCHNGPGLSDGNLHNVVGTTDAGRQLDTGLSQDIGKFKTAPLIGLSSSGPYFHDGSASTLTQVVESYNEGFPDNPSKSFDIRPLNLLPNEVADLVAFLEGIPTVTQVPDPPTLGNHVMSYGVGCPDDDCFWMVVEGVVPIGVVVELRDADSGAIVETMIPNYSLDGDTTVLTGRLAGSSLTTFQEVGLLLNIRYSNENGRVIRSGPRFIRSIPTWPGDFVAPSISGAGGGGGGVVKDWIWIAATGLNDFTVIEVSNPQTGEVVALYSGSANKIWGYKAANVIPAEDTVTLQVDPSLWPVFATTGLRVRLIKRHFTNALSLQSNEKVVTSPGLGGW